MDLTGIQAAKILGVTPSRISQMRKSDGLLLDPEAFGNWWRDRNAAQADELDLAHERARLAKEQADRTALENEKTRRELIPVQDVEMCIAMSFAAISQDLQAIPDNLERRHGIEPDVAEHVEKAIFEAMDALADRLSILGLDRDDDSHS